MPSFERKELKDLVDRWLADNEEAERVGDWKPLAEYYADDASYGWNIGPKEDVMCVGKAEIRDIALGTEMEGLEGWSYPYQKVIIDEELGEIVGFWKQIATTSDGSQEEVYGIGGSWFQVGEDLKFTWQRDFFDFGHAATLYGKLIKAGKLSEGMQKRIQRQVSGEPVPGWFPIGSAPLPLW